MMCDVGPSPLQVCLAEIKAVDPVTGFYKVIHSTKLVDTSVDLSQQ